MCVPVTYVWGVCVYKPGNYKEIHKRRKLRLWKGRGRLVTEHSGYPIGRRNAGDGQAYAGWETRRLRREERGQTKPCL